MNERLIDILLLAIIDANQPANANTPREDRLAEAKKALFGTARATGNKILNDDKAMLAIAHTMLKDNAPTLAHEYLAARARLKGEAFDQEAPPEPELASLMATIKAALKDDSVPKSSKHSEEAAYKRLKRKMQKGSYTLRNLTEIEELEDGTLPELKTIAEILALLEKLGVSVGHNEPN